MRALLLILLLTGCGPDYVPYDTDCFNGCNKTKTIVEPRQGEAGVSGTNGINGTNGVSGQDGTDGTSCTVEDHPDGAEIVCGEDSQVVKDGQKASYFPITYVGSFCGRSVIRQNTKFLILNTNQAIPLSGSWYVVTPTCSVRVHKKIIYTR